VIRRLVVICLLASVMVWASPAPAGNPPVPEKYVSVVEAKAMLDKRERVTFIDVREKEQYDDLHIKGAINIPLGVLPSRLAEVPRTDRVVLY
jgi:3-mercaptopyruvate sulfurtransferase SseA